MKFFFFWKNLCLSICNFSQMKKKSVIIQRPYFVVKQIVRSSPSAMFSSMRSEMLLRVLPTLTVNLNFLLQMIRKKNFFFLHLYFIHLYKTYIAIAVIYIFGMYTTKFIYFNFLHVFRPVPIFLFHFGVFIDKIFFFLLFSFKCKFFHVLYGQKFSLLSYSEEEVKNFHCEAFFNRKNSLGFLS